MLSTPNRIIAMIISVFMFASVFTMTGVVNEVNAAGALSYDYDTVTLKSARIAVVGGGEPMPGSTLIITPEYAFSDGQTAIPSSEKNNFYISATWKVNGKIADEYFDNGSPSFGYAEHAPDTYYIKRSDVGKKITAVVDLCYKESENDNVCIDTITVTYDTAIKAYSGPKVNIKNVKVGYMKTLAYNGYQQFPASLTVRYKGKNLTPNDFTIKLGKNKKVGTGTFTIYGKGRFTGKKTYKFKIKKLSKEQRLKLAKKEAKRLAKLLPKNVKSRKEKAVILFCIPGAAYAQRNQSNKAYKKNFGNEAYAVFAFGNAACSGQTRALVMLCKAAKIPAKHVNAGKWSHQWAKINVGTKAKPNWWKADPQLSMNTKGYEPNWFKTSPDTGYSYIPLDAWAKYIPASGVWPTKWKSVP